MKEKIIYVTEDGKEFENKAVASIHETEMKSRKKDSKEFELVNGKKISKNDINMFFEKMDCPICPYLSECCNAKKITRETGYTYNLCQIIHGGYTK